MKKNSPSRRTPKRHHKHICIDFEGEGRRRDHSVPHPSLLGALVPNTDGHGKHFRLWVFEPELLPLTRSPRITGKEEHRRYCTLKEAVAELVELARTRSCRLVAFSPHELRIIKAHLPEDSPVRNSFVERFYNILPKSRSLAERRHLECPDITLENLLKALSPKHKSPPPPECGAAEACRRLRKAGAKSRRWGNWATEHQQIARELINYNRGDCDAVWRLLNRVTAHYRIPELLNAAE
ncbi:MAG: hypothetical protein P1U68_18420 [Verrucomicrobiales bacterium]|nr:hypothetical protein [Verrucomicrobiales bacterium]MDF2378184.1 hypothetical protein [Verrucomicrobiales bacterium]